MGVMFGDNSSAMGAGDAFGSGGHDSIFDQDSMFGQGQGGMFGDNSSAMGAWDAFGSGGHDSIFGQDSMFGQDGISGENTSAMGAGNASGSGGHDSMFGTDGTGPGAMASYEILTDSSANVCSSLLVMFLVFF